MSPQFSTVIFHCGGTGARPGKDGLDVTAFPSGVRTIPVEATEIVAPVIFRRREFREGSGGAGKYRGGLGQVIELGGADGTPISAAVQFRAHQQPGARPRRRRAGRARHGRRSSPASRSARRAGRPCRRGDFIRLELPGGGGFGDPRERDPDQVAADVADGLITREAAERDYGVGADAGWSCRRGGTARLRA